MEADARTFLTFVGPLAIAYMTYSSVQGTAVAGKPNDLKSVSFSQIGTAPKMPSAETKLRNPFVPARSSGGVAAAVSDESAPDPEKSNEPLRLDGTAMIGKLRFAIINGMRVTEGDYFRGMRLTKVDATQVTLTTPDALEQIVPLTIAKSDAIQIPDRMAHDDAKESPLAAGVRKLVSGSGGGTGSKSPAAKAGSRH